MDNEKVCVFCGKKLGFFHSAYISCAGTYQPCCKNCQQELNDLNEEEQCRCALKLGLADQPEKLEAFIEVGIEVGANAEAHRPTCMYCGAKLRFQAVECLNNNPFRDWSTFDVLPAVCENCGKYEFYAPEIAKRNEYLAHLIKIDAAE